MGVTWNSTPQVQNPCMNVRFYDHISNSSTKISAKNNTKPENSTQKKQLKQHQQQRKYYKNSKNGNILILKTASHAGKINWLAPFSLLMRMGMMRETCRKLK